MSGLSAMDIPVTIIIHQPTCTIVHTTSKSDDSNHYSIEFDPKSRHYINITRLMQSQLHTLGKYEMFNCTLNTDLDITAK